MSKTVYRTAMDIVVRRVGDESVVVPVRNRVGDLDSIFTLNEVASRVWELLDGQRPVDQIVGVICDEFEVAPDVADADVRELLGSLEQAHLVEAVGA
jgi:pyrroloquinoline quinone biosynthesis protein D